MKLCQVCQKEPAIRIINMKDDDEVAFCHDHGVPVLNAIATGMALDFVSSLLRRATSAMPSPRSAKRKE